MSYDHAGYFHAASPDSGCETLDALQRDFAAALLDPARPVPPGLTGPDGASVERRFAVYRNNVVAGLCDALGAAYPVTRRIVGDAFFDGMARIHAAKALPASPVMLDYGEGFADFIGTFEPAMSLPYLRDVARLERAWAEAYHAPDAAPLDPETFNGIEAEHLPSICLALHPSVRIVRSAFPVVAIWQMNIDDGAPGFIDIHERSEDACVARPRAHVEVRALPRGAAAFIEALAAEIPVADAFQRALADDARFDLSRTLAMLMHDGAITGWTLPDEVTR